MQDAGSRSLDSSSSSPGSSGCLPPSARPDRASGDAVAYYYIHYPVAQLVETYLLDGVAGATLLVFVAALHAVFRQSSEGSASDGSRTLANVVFGAGVAAASVSFVQAGIGSALTHHEVLLRAGVLGIQMLVVFINDMDTYKLLALAMLTGCAAILILQWHVMPAWLGWLGALETVLLIIGGLSWVFLSTTLYPVLYLAQPLLLVWVAAVSLVSLLGAGTTHGTAM